ncbi:DMP19 family protein [Paenibacillus borealis]|uniref:Uncharacterized protein n=1 Tax=Paenibacillus borealis TaxID=160799 RepID=A0A089LGA1_PAEBO|nr:DUF4375 domain-containing protein [Paenibacillus borealis]AIQ59130.1 hypothetical protein PBOR_20980 [Paenibacillus borealis]
MVPVTMEREIFNMLSDERLGYACMEPTFVKIRAKSTAVKNEAISQLGRGQRALCMFRILYDHSSRSAEEYYGWICYLLDQPGYWNSVLEGLQFFGDTPLIRLLEESKELFEARNLRVGTDWSDAAITDLEADPELHEAVITLYTQYQELTAHSLQIIAGYIRAHPEEFIVFKDGPV